MGTIRLDIRLALSLFSQWQDGSLAAKSLQDLNILPTLEEARQLNPTDVLLAVTAATIYRDHPKLVLTAFPDTNVEEPSQGQCMSRCAG